MTVFSLFWFSLTNAALLSPIPSTVEGLSIPNSHSVGNSSRVVRGMAPLDKVNELAEFGVTDVLIFKNQTNHEVDDEIEALQTLSDPPSVKVIGFRWKGFTSYRQACEMMIEGLLEIRSVYDRLDRKLFFHCTVGEDRTGALAGLWRMLETGESLKTVFQKELCERGYSRANPRKPTFVVNAIRKELTPLFVEMGMLIEAGLIEKENLDTSVCQHFDGFEPVQRKDFKCPRLKLTDAN